MIRGAKFCKRALLQLLYQDQTGSVHGSMIFDIVRGVKQGDVLSTILFNCVLDVAFENWLLELTSEGIFIHHSCIKLTNTRYADDILLYARSLGELERMTELLVEELNKVALQLNA